MHQFLAVPTPLVHEAEGERGVGSDWTMAFCFCVVQYMCV